MRRLVSGAFALWLCVSPAAAATKWHPSLPNPLRFFTDQPAVVTVTAPDAISFSFVAAVRSYVIGLPWCFATATILATMIERRELERGEVYVIAGSCVLPILGGLIIKQILKRHPAPLYTALERRPTKSGPTGIPYFDSDDAPGLLAN